ncbi:MAG TPA: helix-turn-helix transcriptional regulator [Pseudogracilibacillus sp.]|nr:helix-turn-helix transcriptional regulator [Pseudogracilibacillus sp.]
MRRGVFMVGNDSALQMTSVSLNVWLTKYELESTAIWNEQWTEMLKREDKEELERYLQNFCFSLLDLSDEDQLFIVRTVYVSILTDLLRVQSRKKMLRPALLTKSYEMIYEVESWENISQFILNIPLFLSVVVDDLLTHTPLHDACPRIEKAIRLINEQITSRELTVKWLAEQLHISTTHLANLFRLNVGMNVSEYIAKRKVTEISYDIVYTSMPLAKIREKYGFVSHSHFIQFFKRHKGKTPLKYRQYVLKMTDEEEMM